MPNVFACVWFESNDGTSEKILAALRTPILLVPRSAVANADVQKIKLRIVDDGVPNRAAASDLPPCAGPRLCSLRENRLFEWFRRIARDGIKAPHQLACLRVIGRHVAAHAEFGTTVTDNYFALHD